MIEKLLTASNVNASYGKKQILNNVSVELHGGELTCLCGPNGSGKSTLMSVLAKLAPKALKVEFGDSAGGNGADTVWLESAARCGGGARGGGGCFPYILESSSEKEERIEYYSLRPLEIAKKIAYMQQNEYSVWDFSASDFVLCGRYCHTKNGNYRPEDYEKVNQIMAELELTELAERKIHTLSGGEFQKLRLARALVQEPDFLFLDEPANNLDFIYEPKLMTLLRKIAAEKNIGILIIMHDINLAARFADKLIFLRKLAGENGVAGGTDEAAADVTAVAAAGQSRCTKGTNGAICGKVNQVFTSENLKETFGVELQTYTHPIYNCIQVYEK